MKAELVPLETALLSAAREQAAVRRKEAETRAAEVARESEARARALLEHAVAEGERVAEREAAHRLVEARRKARALVLGAERAAYERLLAEAVSVTRMLHEQPEYADLEGRLVEVAQAVLGPETEIVRNPDGQGGVQARNGGRSVDLSLPTLARRCVGQLGQAVTRLWS